MARLYGRQCTRQELLRRVGLVEQVAGVRLGELADGVGRGVRTAHMRTGSGLSLTVLVDRGLDIYDAEYNGIPLAWVSPTGPTHPAYFEEPGFGWLRGFYGGLVVTCGLTTAGAPSVDEGQSLGLHGRVSNLPASNVHAGGTWQGDEYVLFVAGQVRETRVFGEDLVLERRIEARTGESKIAIYDTVRNEGFQRTPHMMLYHINLGFPVVDDGSRLVTPARSVRPRDAEAEKGIADYARFSAPIPGYREQVFYHDNVAAADGYVTAALVNPAFNGGQGFGVYVRYRQRELPRFTEWKMVGEGTYVVGMEPANCLVEGRAKERERGTLQFLEPGEERSYHVEIGIIQGRDDIARLEEKAKILAR